MGLHVSLMEFKEVEISGKGITHNLAGMAREAGIYDVLWKAEEAGIKKAGQLIEPLEKARALMLADRKRFERFNSPNGWGTYADFMIFVQSLLDACRDNPGARIVSDP